MLISRRDVFRGLGAAALFDGDWSLSYMREQHEGVAFLEMPPDALVAAAS